MGRDARPCEYFMLAGRKYSEATSANKKTQKPTHREISQQEKRILISNIHSRLSLLSVVWKQFVIDKAEQASERSFLSLFSSFSGIFLGSQWLGYFSPPDIDFWEFPSQRNFYAPQTVDEIFRRERDSVGSETQSVKKWSEVKSLGILLFKPSEN